VAIAVGLAVKPLMDAGGAPALTVATALTGVLAPPGPVHVSVNVTVPAAVRGRTLVPVLEMPMGNDAHPPAPADGVQELALVVVQARDTVWPICTAEGVTVKDVIAAGGGPDVTLTVTLSGALVPPGPVQVRVYV
jgi:hypothetical protein